VSPNSRGHAIRMAKIEAYNLYLKGLYFLRLYTADGFQEGDCPKNRVNFFEDTIFMELT